MAMLKNLVAIIFSSSFYLFTLVVGVFGLPLNVIAIMHHWGYEWWGALLLAVFIGFVPFVGQLAYVILAIMGAYYFYQADFSWREATQPSLKIFDVSTLSDQQFDEYKKQKFYPEIVQSCMTEGQKRFGIQGAIPSKFATFCDCYAGAIISVMTKADFAVGPNQPDMEPRIRTTVREKCHVFSDN
jgi:hypothetical protein